MKKEPLYVAFLGKTGMEGTQKIGVDFFYLLPLRILVLLVW